MKVRAILEADETIVCDAKDDTVQGAMETIKSLFMEYLIMNARVYVEWCGFSIPLPAFCGRPSGIPDGYEEYIIERSRNGAVLGWVYLALPRGETSWCQGSWEYKFIPNNSFVFCKMDDWGHCDLLPFDSMQFDSAKEEWV